MDGMGGRGDISNGGFWRGGCENFSIQVVFGSLLLFSFLKVLASWREFWSGKCWKAETFFMLPFQV